MTTGDVHGGNGSATSWRDRALAVFPAGSNGEFGIPISEIPILARGEGPRVWDTDGRAYLDFTMAWGSALPGHAHPKIREAVTAALPDGYDRDRIYWQYVRAREASIDILRGYAPQVKQLLTTDQRRKLPPFIATALDDRYLKTIRSGTAGGGGNMMFPGAMMGAGGMGAGGAQTIIMRQ